MRNRRANHKTWSSLLILLVLLGMGTSASAQMGMGGGGGSGAYALAEGERNLKFAGIPIPSYSDVLGFNMAVVAMAYYKMDRNDDSLPPSSSGIFGFYSENKSWMGGLFQKFHLDGDKWRTTAAYMNGSIKYQFNPASIGPGFPDVFLDYTSANNMIFAQGSRRTWDKLYLGLAVLSWSSQNTFGDDLIVDAEETYTGPGFLAEWDKRDHIMYPTDGVSVDGRFLFFSDTFGSDRDFRKLNLSVAGYEAVSDSTGVLAGRILYEGGFGDVPFSGQSMVNGNRNLRGYSNGRYRADHLLVLESEYRWKFHKRWGAVAFAGVAWSAKEVSLMSLDDSLPAAGLGLRWTMIESYKINARVDYAWGKDDQAIYVAIGEAY
ncbi:MAG: hypothetical protein ACI9UK_001292 [Candidatus Krumholzibacteriia bacterium]|jgi:hypothetical protein